MVQLAQAVLRARARAACPSGCSACTAPTSLLTPARPYRIQISPDHCLLERNGQVHLYWKCWYNIDYDSRESKNRVPYLSHTFVILSLPHIRSVPVVRTVTKPRCCLRCRAVQCSRNTSAVLAGLCQTMLWTKKKKSSGHLRTSDRDCQKQRLPQSS